MRDGRVAGHWLGGHETESRQRGRVSDVLSGRLSTETGLSVLPLLEGSERNSSPSLA